MRFPHNQFNLCCSQKELGNSHWHGPRARRFFEGDHQPHIWLEGQDPKTVEFIDVIYTVGVK